MEIDSFQGVPDEYSGRVLVKRYSSTTSMSSLTLTAAKDTYIIQAPSLGDAFWYTQDVGTGAFAITAVPYPDVTTLFPVGFEASNADAFRIASNSIEIVPTVNSMTWTGAIEVWKTTVTAHAQPGATGYDITTLNGLEGILSLKPSGVFPFNLGMYSPSRPSVPVLPFRPVLTSETHGNIFFSMPSGKSAAFTAPTVSFLGIGDMEATIIKIPAYSAAGNSCLIRTWSCVEMQVNSYSALYEYQHISPAYDPLALQLLTEFFNTHPVAVTYFENDTFWQKMLAFIRTVSAGLSVLPGPAGSIATGVNLISTALS